MTDVALYRCSFEKWDVSCDVREKERERERGREREGEQASRGKEQWMEK